MPRQAARAPNHPQASPASSMAPQYGAIVVQGGVRFRVFAPGQRDLRLHLLSGAAAGIHAPTTTDGEVVEFFVREAGAGDRYAYSIDGSDLRPDPASRYQPEGVHRPSEVVDAEAYRWRHDTWPDPDPRRLVIYELHVGTFSPAGTFAGVREHLGALRDLGVTAIELMPVAEFAGTRNWGYDGVGLYAPSRNYGRPDDLRALVDAAHGLGIAVILDVVYNHLGPEGAYLPQFLSGYITDRHHTPWGGAIDLDGPGAGRVRGFILDNAAHWIREYRLDGLRLDATHALIDESPTHLVAELGDRLRGGAGRRIVLHAEDHRNLATMLEPRERGGWDLDGVWADDFHHVLRRRLGGDTYGYYRDFTGTADELARTIRQGWLFSGQHSEHAGKPRGSDASGVPMRKFVVCLQNHDQIGNRANGDRLHHMIEPAAWRAASALLLTVPMTPLLFMGQEWSASTPFLYFTDLEPDLGRLVTEGRRQEFRDFPDFADPDQRERIPDPQAPETFAASRLRWDERDGGLHAATLALYRDLLRLRREHPALTASDELAGDAMAIEPAGLVMRRRSSGPGVLVVALLAGAGDVACDAGSDAVRQLLSTEDAAYAADPKPPRVEIGGGRLAVRFERPGAVLFEIA